MNEAWNIVKKEWRAKKKKTYRRNNKKLVQSFRGHKWDLDAHALNVFIVVCIAVTYTHCCSLSILWGCYCSFEIEFSLFLCKSFIIRDSWHRHHCRLASTWSIQFSVFTCAALWPFIVWKKNNKKLTFDHSFALYVERPGV